MLSAAWTAWQSLSMPYKTEQEDLNLLPISCPYAMWVNFVDLVLWHAGELLGWLSLIPFSFSPFLQTRNLAFFLCGVRGYFDLVKSDQFHLFSWVLRLHRFYMSKIFMFEVNFLWCACRLIHISRANCIYAAFLLNFQNWMNSNVCFFEF